MTDRMPEGARRKLMSRIRGKETGPELALRHALWVQGLRYRLHCQKLPGRPDIVFHSAKVAVFVDGCFWHNCPQHRVMPKSNVGFWQAKLRRNRDRDQKVTQALISLGWEVIRIWEHDIDTNVDAQALHIGRIVARRLRGSRKKQQSACKAPK